MSSMAQEAGQLTCYCLPHCPSSTIDLIAHFFHAFKEQM